MSTSETSVITLEVRSRHPQDYRLHNLADGSVWQPADRDGGWHWVRDDAKAHNAPTGTESALREIAALHTAANETWLPTASTDYMTCRGCDINIGGDGMRRLWKNCPTRALVPADFYDDHGQVAIRRSDRTGFRA